MVLTSGPSTSGSGSPTESSSTASDKTDQALSGLSDDVDRIAIVDKSVERPASPSPSATQDTKESGPHPLFHGGSLREDDLRAHPDLYPFLSRRPAHSTAPLPELLHEYAYFAQGEYEDNVAEEEDEEDVEQLAESERQAIEQEFGPEEALFDDDEVRSGDDQEDTRRSYGREEEEVQQVEMAGGMTEEEMRKERSRLMAEEYERNCGSLWTDYRACLQVSLTKAGDGRYPTDTVMWRVIP